MIIDVRPTPRRRRHRARIAGAVAAVAMLTASLVSVATLAQQSRPDQQHAPHSEPVAP